MSRRPLNLSARWLGAMSDDQLRAWLSSTSSIPIPPIALYGSPEDNASAYAARLKQTGFTRLQHPERCAEPDRPSAKAAAL